MAVTLTPDEARKINEASFELARREHRASKEVVVMNDAADLTGDSERKAFAHAKAEKICRSFGTAAPDPAPSESSLQYRKRVAQLFQKFSPEWKGVDVRPLDRNAFERIEERILADATQEAREPTNVPAGQIVERVLTDPTGRRITKFFGDTRAVWGPFQNVRRLGRIAKPE